MSLTGKSPADTYKDLLKVPNNNSGIDSTARIIESGNGSDTAMSLSDRALAVKSNTNNTKAFTVANSGGTSRLSVDTTNDQVKALGHHINTQYTDFGIAATLSANYLANTHYPIPFSANNQALANQDDITFGTSTDPATTFTTADGAATDSSILVPAMWYLPDAITIDSVIALQGLEQAGTNTTRCHLFSYTFTSGSTSALTSGTLLAHSADLSNAGSEQAYLQTWTVDSASVTAGKVILAFFRMDTAADDFSVTVTVKYHLT